MEFNHFFNFHLKLLRIIGLRLHFGGFSVAKWFRGYHHFWLSQLLTFFLITVRVCYMFMLRSSIEYALFGSCGFIYLVEGFVKALEIQKNSDKIDAYLEKLKTMYGAANDQNDFGLRKYSRIFGIYVRSMLATTLISANAPMFGAIVSYIISGKVIITIQGVKFMPFNSLALNIVMYIPQYFCALFQCFYPLLDSLIMMLSIQLIYPFRKISQEFEKLCEKPPGDAFMKDLVEQHNTVLRYLKIA